MEYRNGGSGKMKPALALVLLLLSSCLLLPLVSSVPVSRSVSLGNHQASGASSLEALPVQALLYFCKCIGLLTLVAPINSLKGSCRYFFGSVHRGPSSKDSTRGNEINIVLWGARAREFEADEIRAASGTGTIIAVFVGTLPKMYRGVKGLSGSSACRWYIDEDLPEINAFRARYCVCTFGSDDTAESEFMFFDRAARSLVGKSLMTLIQSKYPGFTEISDLVQIGGGDVPMTVEISRIVTQKYSLVVSISNKSFQPASTQLSFQVSRIDQVFKPELAPLGFADPHRVPETSSSAAILGEAVPSPSSFPMGASTLVVLPLNEMSTHLSAFKGKGHATMPRTPSKSPCPKSARRKLFASPSKLKDAKLPVSTVDVAEQLKESASAADVVEAAAMPTVDQETGAASNEDSKSLPTEQTKTKRGIGAAKGASGPKKAKQ